MQVIRHQAVDAAGIACADLSDNTRPAPLTVRRSEFVAQRRARAIDRLVNMAFWTGSVIAGGFIGLLLGAF